LGPRLPPTASPERDVESARWPGDPADCSHHRFSDLVSRDRVSVRIGHRYPLGMTDEDESRGKKLARWTDEHLYEPVRKSDAGGRHAPRLPKFIPSLVILLIVGLIGAWFIFAGLARLRGSDVSWFWPDIGSLSADGALFDVTRSTATLAALVAGLFAAVYAYRKQRVDEAAGKRADDEALSQRYQDAAEQIGHDKAAVRLAGVYAMTRLADDWAEQRQTCINVLCAYLRMPAPSESGGEPNAADLEIRTSILQIVIDHVTSWKQIDIPSWSDNSFDFSNAVLHNLDFVGLEFRETLSFRGTQFFGKCQMVNIRSRWGADLTSAVIAGTFELHTIDSFEIPFCFAKGTVSKGADLKLMLYGHESTFIDLTGLDVLGGLLLIAGADGYGNLRVNGEDVVVNGHATIGTNGSSRSEMEKEWGVPHLNLTGWKIYGPVHIDERVMNRNGFAWDPAIIDKGGVVTLIEHEESE